jgi:ornithine cyclodeaminase/alanine dehydrogenase-like protein (mu-crystallin family)
LVELTYLSQADIESLDMSMSEVLDAVELGFAAKGRGHTEMPPKPGIHTRPDCFIHAMPAYVQELEVAGLKWVSGYPPNPGNGLPYISGLLVLNDCQTGFPLAVMDCAWITAMRTGASAGISAKYLARANSATAAIIGCGVQARTSLMALVETLPALADVRCYDLFPEATQRFTSEMAVRFPALRLTACASAAEAARAADVVVTAIPIVVDPKPDLDVSSLREGGLAVSLDYDSAWTGAAMSSCDKFCSDDVGQLLATKEQGVYFGGIPGAIHADLGELAAGLKPGRESDSERIFSMNMGIAVDDMVTAKVLYERALERGVGVRLPL